EIYVTGSAPSTPILEKDWVFKISKRKPMISIRIIPIEFYKNFWASKKTRLSSWLSPDDKLRKRTDFLGFF
ncbi:hypothetical protein, partial [Chromobacterium haemolyticum]|uniref:hypothetical protein n=1 Tax=Chromobacterium TaxID=535 RepID=UPI00405660AC